ncbi:MAG: DUF2339 domain-containing protein, partial [Bryobacterales bacterium]|nr:DUF2339 domain-containing protein [Bryobacterales bacterium]
LNRWLTKADPLLTYAATALLASGAATLAPERWFGVAWLVIALVLAELYQRFNLTEFRYQTAALGALAVFVNLLLGIGDGAAHRNTVVTVETLSALLCYGIAFRLQGRDELLRMGASWGGTLLAACAIWTALPREFVALGWAALSAILLERGVRTESKLLRLQAHLLFLAAFVHVFLENLIPDGVTPAWPQLLTVAPLILLAIWGRYRTPESDPRVAYSWAAVLITVALVRRQLALGPTLTCWAAIMVALSVLHRRFSLRECRYQSFFTGLLTYAGASYFMFDASEPNLAVRLASVASVIAAFHAVQFLSTWEDRARGAFALAGSTLLAMLLYQESSGNLLTISWGAQAVLTLGAGFATRERLLRLTGLALFFVCILKLFLYDLRELDTLGRIVSFIVLGLVLIGASWLYMRFKNQIQKYL